MTSVNPYRSRSLIPFSKNDLLQSIVNLLKDREPDWTASLAATKYDEKYILFEKGNHSIKIIFELFRDSADTIITKILEKKQELYKNINNIRALPQFSGSLSRCIKCHSAGPKSKFKTCWDEDGMTKLEYLERECFCGYTWKERAADRKAK